jgi:hypothetical protein
MEEREFACASRKRVSAERKSVDRSGRIDHRLHRSKNPAVDGLLPGGAEGGGGKAWNYTGKFDERCM